jgi:hypothetical protein
LVPLTPQSRYLTDYFYNSLSHSASLPAAIFPRPLSATHLFKTINAFSNPIFLLPLPGLHLWSDTRESVPSRPQQQALKQACLTSHSILSSLPDEVSVAIKVKTEEKAQPFPLNCFLFASAFACFLHSFALLLLLKGLIRQYGTLARI